MSDIVERLRLYPNDHETADERALMGEAADLIEKLRRGNERIEKQREAADMEIAALRARLEATE